MRKKNSFKNFLTDFFPYILFGILGFVQVKIFVKSLGEEIYSLNQLFIQLFSYISLVEGGVGAIICQKYYKYFVNNDKENIKRTYASSVSSMRKISIIIFIIGIIMSFFLNILTNNSLSLYYMQFVFILYLIRSIIEYLNLSPRFVIQANQKLYKINIILNIYKLLEVIITILCLLYKIDYMYILIITIIIRLVMYYCVNLKIYKEYPYLKDVKINNPPKIRGIGYMYYHKIAGAVYNNTDILLISSTLNPFYVTMYSSYNYICKYINDVIYMLGNSLTASLGNVLYSEKDKTSFDIFEEINSMFLFFGAFFTINVYILSDNFIGIWIGKEYTTNSLIAIFMSILLFASISKRALSILWEAKGMFKETRIIVFWEALLNVIFSIILIHFYQINGILFATIASYLLTTFWYYPRFVYKNVFKQNYIKYYRIYFLYLSLIIIIGVFYKLFINISINNFKDWLICGLLSSISTGIIIFGISYVFLKPFKRIVKKLIMLVKRK